jgi:hypothetical protein
MVGDLIWARVDGKWHRFLAQDRAKAVIYLKCKTVFENRPSELLMKGIMAPGVQGEDVTQYCPMCAGVGEWV